MMSNYTCISQEDILKTKMDRCKYANIQSSNHSKHITHISVQNIIQLNELIFVRKSALAVSPNLIYIERA